MNTAYIYSANRVNALSTEFLQSADIERLLGATTEADRIKALQESYLAPYLDADDAANANNSLEKSIQSAKELLVAIAPNPRLLQVLWYRYDIHNLRVFIKGRILDLDYEAMASHLSNSGIYDATYLYEHMVQDTLYRLMPELHQAYHAAWRLAESKAFDELDLVLDQACFAGALRLAEETRDLFVRDFVKLEIDLHNAFVALRAQAVPAFDLHKLFVPGGTFSMNQCGTYEQAIARLAQYGGSGYWQAALDEHQAKQNTTALDRTRDAYRLQFVTERVHDIFSVASLFAYALRVQQSAATVRTIMVGADSGLSHDTIREQLRISN